ncbi:hypothetical protein Tco_1223985, partial [Tanacetum coccineum]
MSADSAVTYTSVHSEARSWSIPSEDPYEEAARQLLEQAPRSPDPRALEGEMRDVASALYHSLHLLGTPPLLPIPLPAPFTSRRADIPEADTPPRKRLLLTTPRPGCEVRESSAAARQPRPTMTHRVDYSFVDTMETRFRDTKRRMMTALEMVNMRELEEPMKDQLLPDDASPTALSPGYISDSDPEEDEEDPKEDPVDYPTAGGDNDNNESSDDDNDDNDVERMRRTRRRRSN